MGSGLQRCRPAPRHLTTEGLTRVPTETQKLAAILGALEDFHIAPHTLVLAKTPEGYRIAAGDPAAPLVETTGPVLGEAVAEAHRRVVEMAQAEADNAQQTAETARQEALRWADVLARARGGSYP